MNPSVGALKRILDGLPMGLAEFFAIEPERPRRRSIAPTTDRRSARSRSPSARSATICSGRSLQILKERYEPGSDTGRVPLTHDRRGRRHRRLGPARGHRDDERRFSIPAMPIISKAAGAPLFASAENRAK
jgi:hypothetical protein